MIQKVTVDTNVLLDNPDILLRQDIEFVVPYVVLAELDKLKRQQDLSFSARNAIKSIMKGYKDGTIKVVGIPNELQTNDEKIVDTAKEEGSLLWSRDVGANVIALTKSVGLFEDDVQEYDKDYTGMRELLVPQEWYYDFICKVNEAQHAEVEVPLGELLKDNPININEYVVFKPNDESLNSIIFRKTTEKFVHVSSSNKIFKTLSKDGRKVDIEFLSDEQVCAFDAVFNTDTPLCIIQGRVGCLVGGETIDVEMEPIYISREELYQVVNKQYPRDRVLFGNELKILLAKGILKKYIVDGKDMYDLLDLNPTNMLFFSSKTRQDKADFYYEFFEENHKYLFTSLRYWYNFFERDEVKAKDMVNYVRKLRANRLDNNIEGYKDTASFIKANTSPVMLRKKSQKQANITSLTKEFWKIRGFSEQEAEEHISRIQKENNRRVVAKYTTEDRKRRSYLNKTYHIERGKTEEEAIELINKTRLSQKLSQLIDEFGEEEGTKKWRERQDKWQNTLKSKPDYEDIVKRKSMSRKEKGKDKYGNTEKAGEYETYMKERVMTTTEQAKNHTAIWYYIKFWNEDTTFWKVGMTRRPIHKRFKNKDVFKAKYNLNYEVVDTYTGSAFDCYQKEQDVLRKFKEHRVKINYNGFTSTECFSKDVLKGTKC